uniref:Uncharacterized protein n=1 Tax=viral metagenome TaxID=1070528 RepID=A0A6C0AZM6_9ZZZZ
MTCTIIPKININTIESAKLSFVIFEKKYPNIIVATTSKTAKLNKRILCTPVFGSPKIPLYLHKDMEG